jgi:hypothetical protein
MAGVRVTPTVSARPRLGRPPVTGDAQGPAMHQIGTASPVHQSFVREWERLRHHRDALRRAAGWHLVEGPLTDLDQIVALTVPTRPDDERERALHRLVELARDDDLAARVLLQRLLPDLVLLHRRRRWQRWHDVGFGDLLATGWMVIRTYNPRRRPARLARSLVSDIEYREYRAALRRIGHGDPSDPRGFDEIVDTPAPDPLVELAGLVTDPAAGLSDDDRELLRRLLSGRMAIEVARELEITPRTLRNRRDRIAGKLREVALAA